MNPFFWFLVLLATVLLWFVLRRVFIAIGSKAADVMQDTKEILNSDGENENNGGNENA